MSATRIAARAACAVLVAALAGPVPLAAQDYVLIDADGNDISIEDVGVADAPSAFPWLRLQDLTATRERPLFSPDRTAPAAAPPEPEPEPAVVEAEPEPEPDTGEAEPPTVRLAGVVANGELRIALLEDAASSEIVRLSPGQAIADWVLVEIEPRAVLLRHGEQELRVVMGAEAADGADAPEVADGDE